MVMYETETWTTRKADIRKSEKKRRQEEQSLKPAVGQPWV